MSRKRNLRLPQSTSPLQDAKEKALADEANLAFDVEQHSVAPPLRENEYMPGVPLDETLDPEKALEYCNREPWILSDVKECARRAKFGIIPARFKAEALKLRQAGDIDNAAKHETAMRESYKIYHEQIKRDFRELTGRLQRNELGSLAQSIWRGSFGRMTNPDAASGGNFVASFFKDDVAANGDIVLQKLASETACANLKWLCLNINEIPVNALTGPSYYLSRSAGQGPRSLN